MIYMLGDVHGNFDHVLETVKASGEKPIAVIFLGDLECQVPYSQCVAEIEAAGIQCWAIFGNHDTDSTNNFENLWGDSLFQKRNLHGCVVEIAGIRVAGLGGVFRGEIWYPPNEDVHFSNYDEYMDWLANKQPLRLRDTARTSGKGLKHRSSIFYKDFIRLYGQTADILVCHEAPSCHPHGFSEIDSLAQSLHAKFVFHGHHHDSLNFRPHDQRLGFATYGVGFMGITDCFGGMIRPGSFDEAPQYRQQHPEGTQ